MLRGRPLPQKALEVRRNAHRPAQVADTLHSIGSLKLKQRELEESEGYFRQALALRETLKTLKGDERTRAQALGQSHTTLGNLYIQMGDQDGRTEDERVGLYRKALAEFAESGEAYARGLHEKHPKVAWALEGLARGHEKLGQLDEALGWYERVYEIRSGASHGGATNYSPENEATWQKVEEVWRPQPRAYLGTRTQCASLWHGATRPVFAGATLPSPHHTLLGAISHSRLMLQIRRKVDPEKKHYLHRRSHCNTSGVLHRSNFMKKSRAEAAKVGMNADGVDGNGS